jgi:hypothetical protein
MQSNNNNHNVWRTVAWTIIAVIVVAYIWRTTEGSNDLQLLLLGGLLFGPILLGVGMIIGRAMAAAPRDEIREDAYEHGYGVGCTEGFDNGYNYAVQQYGRRLEHATPLQQIPQQAKELAVVYR